MTRGLVSGACGLSKTARELSREAQSQADWHGSTLATRDAAELYRGTIAAHHARERVEDEAEARRRTAAGDT
jgi:hypothetical protein